MLFTLNLMKNPCWGTAGPRGELSTFILLSKHSIKLLFQFVCLRILVYLSHLIRYITLLHGWWSMQKLTTDQCGKKNISGVLSHKQDIYSLLHYSPQDSGSVLQADRIL